MKPAQAVVPINHLEMKKYKITEIFYSIQGEGYNAGTAAIFIRFAHCNLNCHFCDTDFRQNFQLTADGINYAIKELVKDKIPLLIILTGGEPMLQADKELLTSLKSLASWVKICIETNGTIIPEQEVLDNLDWITVSPKDTWEDKKWKLRAGDELKLVYDDQDLNKYYEDTEFMNYYLQPMDLDGIQNLGKTVRAVLDNPMWHVSMQQQKIWNIR